MNDRNSQQIADNQARRRTRFRWHCGPTVFASSVLLAGCDRAAFWPTVAFHNFVQFSVGEVVRVRRSRQQWEQGHGIFPTILGKLKARHGLASGRCVMKNLRPFDAPQRSAISVGNKTTAPGQTGLCRTEDRTFALALEIPHPSSRGFSVSEWQPPVRAFRNTRSAIEPMGQGTRTDQALPCHAMHCRPIPIP